MNAPTWLDRTLVGGGEAVIRDAGFGHEVRTALAARQQWLAEQELVAEKFGAIRYPSDLLATLQRREFMRIAGRLSEELGKNFVEAKAGAQIDGVYARRLDLQSGRFALIEKSREFSLVPWKPVIEKQLGKPVSGIVREVGDSRTVNWQIGRDRGPTIS